MIKYKCNCPKRHCLQSDHLKCICDELFRLSLSFSHVNLIFTYKIFYSAFFQQLIVVTPKFTSSLAWHIFSSKKSVSALFLHLDNWFLSRSCIKDSFFHDFCFSFLTTVAVQWSERFSAFALKIISLRREKCWNLIKSELFQVLLAQ